MKRLLILLGVLMVVGGVVLVVYLGSPDSGNSSTLGADRLFKVADTDRIYKIFLAHRDGETVTLERKKGYWLYNGKHRANPNAVDNLLDAVGRIQMKYKPAEAAVENMVRDLATYGIKVELYDEGGDLLKVYYVGGGTADERGTHVIMEGSEQPYVGHLPGWQGNLRFRYNLRGDDWRDKTIFAVKADEIKVISIEYPRQKEKSFQLTKTGDTYSVEPYYDITPSIDKPIAPGKAENFVYGFESLVAEAFENDNPRRDSVLQTLPFSIIRVDRTDGSQQKVLLFPVRQMVPGAPVERYFAATGSGDFMLVQDRVFRRILWPYQAFFR